MDTPFYVVDEKNLVVDAMYERGDLIIPEGACQLILQDAKTGTIKHIETVKNMVVDRGKYAIADALRGTTSNSRGEITWCAVGTSAVAPASSDTGLGTELARKLVSVRSWNAAKVATFQTFFTTSEANGTLREAGLFGDDASSIPGSGTLFCKLAISRTKSSSDTLTLNWSVTIG